MREVTIARNIKMMRKKRGYKSAAELCAALCVAGYECSPSLVKGWENGASMPSLIAISALCEVLGVIADDLIFEDASDYDC